MARLFIKFLILVMLFSNFFDCMMYKRMLKIYWSDQEEIPKEKFDVCSHFGKWVRQTTFHHPFVDSL